MLLVKLETGGEGRDDEVGQLSCISLFKKWLKMMADMLLACSEWGSDIAACKRHKRTVISGIAYDLKCRL